MPLYRLLYRSEIALKVCEDSLDRQIDEIVVASVTSNQKVGLTGALIASEGLFVQVLEGPRTPLERTFERICCDARHRKLQLVDLAAADQRVFENWEMIRVDHAVGMTRLRQKLGRTELPPLSLDTASSIVSLMRTALPE